MELALIIVLTIVFHVYFFLQVKSDVKSMKVSVLLNDVMVGLSFGIFGIRTLILTDPFYVNPEVLIGFLILIILSLLGVYGSGDMKAYLAIYAGTAPFAGPGDLRTNAFLIGAIGGCVAALFWNVIIKKRKLTDKGQRFAYFPFLYVNYLMTLMLCIFY